ncbi:MAG TPA: GAF domain-containing protein [Firmicutes bacterium]|nr:GAF domain-containing protein [Bacillota bacterium]
MFKHSPSRAPLSKRANSILFVIVTMTCALLITCGLAYSVTVKLTIQKESIDLAITGALETVANSYRHVAQGLHRNHSESEILQTLGYPFNDSKTGKTILPFLLDSSTNSITEGKGITDKISLVIEKNLNENKIIRREISGAPNPVGIFVKKIEKRWWLITIIPIESSDRSFGTARDISDNMLQALRLQQQLVGLLILSYAFFLALLVMLMKIITSPVKSLTEAAEKYAHGDFDHHVEVPNTMSEIQVLANAFNRMGTDLKAHRDHLQANSRELEIANIVRGEALEKLSRKNRELSAMIETSMLANQLALPEQIIELTSKRLRDDLHLTYVVLYVPTENGELQPRRMPGLPLPVGGRISEQAAEALKRCFDTRSPQRLSQQKLTSDSNKSLALADSSFSYFGERLYLPLEIDTLRIGVLELISQPGQTFDKETESFCRHFLHQMGIILKNKALFHETSQRTTELEKINQVSRAISGKLNMANLLEDVVEHTQKTMNARCAFIGIMENNKLVIRHITPGANDVDLWKEEIVEDRIMGELIRHGHSVLINDLDQDMRVPSKGFIRKNRFRSFIGSPIMHEENVVGLLAGFSHEPFAFTSSDIHFLGLLASQVSIALSNARMYEEIGAQARRRQDQLTVAQKLQRDRMPSFFKQDIAAFTSELKPAYELAGDFCDIFSLGRNTIAVVVGDVANKGVAASLMTFSLLSMFRNIAKTHRPPCEIMDSINTSLISQIKEDGWFATAFYARFNTSNGVLTYSSAGHEMPMWYHADTGEVDMLESTGYPLGIFDSDQFRYETREIAMKQGDRIVFYTDGITDATDMNSNRFGHTKLRNLVKSLGSIHAEKLTSAVIEDVEKFTGGKEQRDDIIVAVLEYQRDPWVHTKTTFKNSGDLVNEILNAIKPYNLDQQMTYGIRLAVDEAFANAWRHGLDLKDDIFFDVSYLISDGIFKLRVKDPGSGFDHESLPDPTVPENLFKTSGRGVFLIRQMMDEVEFNELGNEITITKILPPASETDEGALEGSEIDPDYDMSEHQDSLRKALKAVEPVDFGKG